MSIVMTVNKKNGYITASKGRVQQYSTGAWVNSLLRSFWVLVYLSGNNEVGGAVEDFDKFVNEKAFGGAEPYASLL